MPQMPVSPYSLHIYNVELGLWASMTSVFGVSPLTQEAMNNILLKDGILAFIGTRSEHGQYLTMLKRDHETGIRRCWISLPASTVMSKLGLCLNSPVLERPELVFYGSPLTVTLTWLMEMKNHGLWTEALDLIESSIQRTGYFDVNNTTFGDSSFGHSFPVTKMDVDEALMYIKE